MGKSTKTKQPPNPILARNRRARHEYEVLEHIEAGIALAGSEVKSARAGRVSLLEAFAQFDRGELYLCGAHIAEYVQAHKRTHGPTRQRKLLLHRRELDHLDQAVSAKGLTLIPLSMYLKDGRIKLEVGLCRGKQVHDKRATIKERDQRRELQRALRERR